MPDPQSPSEGLLEPAFTAHVKVPAVLYLATNISISVLPPVAVKLVEPNAAVPLNEPVSHAPVASTAIPLTSSMPVPPALTAHWKVPAELYFIRKISIDELVSVVVPKVTVPLNAPEM